MFIVPITPMGPAADAAQSQLTQNAAGSKIPFADMLADAARQLEETQAESKRDAYNLALGQTDDLHNVMIRSAQSATAIKFTVQLASRAVSAYREIMQMQV